LWLLVGVVVAHHFLALEEALEVIELELVYL
jgi:hypothetical protein